MTCRACGVCCTEISISSVIPGMPYGKPAGVRCRHLTNGGLCGLFKHPDRPAICDAFQASVETCGFNSNDAQNLIRAMEVATCP